MIVQRRVIVKEVYESLLKTRDELYNTLLEQYKNDPEQAKYEYHPNDPDESRRWIYCQGLAFSEADRQTIGREVKAASDFGRNHEKFRYKNCGCCHNMCVSLPQLNKDGNYEIEVYIDSCDCD